MHQRHLRLRRGGECVGLADRIRNPLPDGHHQVGLLHLPDQSRRHTDTHIAAVVGVTRIEQLRPAVGGIDRQHPGFRQPAQIRRHIRIVQRIRQQRPAHHGQRPLRRRQHRRQLVHILRPRPRQSARPRQIHLGVGFLVEDVLGENNRHRPLRPRLRHMKRAGNGFGGGFRLIHLDHQFGDIAQQPRVILLLQSPAPEILALHLPHQHHQGRGVMKRGMNRHHRVRQPRPARHDADP